MMSLVLAAGNGERFAAYPYPKPLLPMPDGRPLIAWVRDRLPVGEQVIVIRTVDRSALGAWIEGMSVIALDHVTDGPLASAKTAQQYISGELLIVHCDVLLDYTAFVHAARQSAAPYACAIFSSNDPRYGYWDGEGVVEKRVVSNRAVSGVFYFRDARIFTQRSARGVSGAGVPSLLDRETFCYCTDSIVDVGSPADYEAFLYG